MGFNGNRLKNKLSEGKITTLLFDLDGTLHSSQSKIEKKIRYSVQDSYLKFTKLDKAAARQRLWKYVNIYGNTTVGIKKEGINLHDFNDHVYGNIDLQGVSVYDGLPEAMHKLHEKYKIILLTNSGRVHIRRVLKHLKLSECFHSTYSFEDFQFLRKPNRKVFEILCSSIDESPEQVCFFDDSVQNIRVAYRYGMSTVIVSNQIAEPPLFHELYYGVDHTVPVCCHGYTHDIVDFANTIL